MKLSYYPPEQKLFLMIHKLSLPLAIPATPPPTIRSRTTSQPTRASSKVGVFGCACCPNRSLFLFSFGVFLCVIGAAKKTLITDSRVCSSLCLRPALAAAAQPHRNGPGCRFLRLFPFVSPACAFLGSWCSQVPVVALGGCFSGPAELLL